MKKYIIAIAAMAVIGTIAIVQASPEGEPFKAIWDAINNLLGNVSDLNTQVDQLEERITQLENRECLPGDTRTCDTGLLGICSAGTMTCNQDWMWGQCVQINQPTLEVCDGIDNDCDGEIDEGCVAIVQDNFNSYTNGSIIGQGNWGSYDNGENFLVQGTTVFEGTKALYNNTPADSVIYKVGTPLSDGRQSFYIKTENRSTWMIDNYAYIRVTKGPWASGAPGLSFSSVRFTQDGNVGYYNGGYYKNFATYNDNEWTLLEIEWRSSDQKARYKVNDGIWTNWDTFANGASFSNFDYVGLDFDLRNGSGGVYFDNLY